MEFKTATALYNYIEANDKVLVFFRTDSPFCLSVVQKVENFVETHLAVLDNLGIKLAHFIVTPTNASDVEVIQVPQFRYFVKGNEKNTFVGDIEFQEFISMLEL